MTVKGLIHEQAQKVAQAVAEAQVTKQYANVIRLDKEYVVEIKKLSEPQDEIATELETIAIENPCGEDTYLWIIAAQIRPSPKYLESLCKILECEEPCVWHEGVVDILYDLADERSIPSLEKALAYDFSYDPTRELAVKILETLAQIGTARAKEIIRGYLRSPSPRLQEEAEILLAED